MTANTETRIELVRTIAAPPERVWDAWTRPEEAARWCCPDPSGTVVVEADVRVGGTYMIRMEFPGATHVARGVYREVSRPRRLVYTWDWEDGPSRMGVDTLVTLELTAVDGGTELRLTHEGFPAAEARDGHDQGWGLCLDRFEALLG